MAVKHGKKYNQAVALIEAERIYTLSEAVELLERTNTVKFDPTIEIHFNLNIDPRQADQMVRSTLSLPHGTGKTKRIGAFTDVGNEAELKAAGVSVAGGDDLIDAVVAGKLDFDIAIATPGMMRKMGKVAKILGPKGIMPNPKAGTVGEDLLAISKELLAGRFEFKNDKQGNIHSIVGKLSFGTAKLTENIESFVKTMKSARPSGVKGSTTFIKTLYICNAMGPGIRVDVNSL
ncbi:50S ribosomal protein L1 [Candidatus Gracilibacteria bacterium]|nr:50S ribosomal protein L1 [Candidatus Gracilibacteria bacterium]